MKHIQAHLVPLVIWLFTFTASVFLSIGVGSTFAKADEQKTPEELCQSLGYTDQTASWAQCVLQNDGDLTRRPSSFRVDRERETLAPLIPLNQVRFPPAVYQTASNNSDSYGILILPFPSNATAINGIEDCSAAYTELRGDPQVSDVTKRTMPVLALKLSRASNSGYLGQRPHLECVDAFVNSGGSADMGRNLCSDLQSNIPVTVIKKNENGLATELRLPNDAIIKLTYGNDGVVGTYQVGNQAVINTQICRNTR
jgi:hypothetical protein